MCRSPPREQLPPPHHHWADAPLDPPPPDTLLTVPSVCTYNLNGLSAYSLTVEGKRRAARLRANIAALTASYSVCNFQETHLLPNDQRPFTRINPSHTIFTSSLSTSSAGVATVLSPTVLRDYSAHSLELHPALQGYALAILLSPRSHDVAQGRPIVLFNLYLDSASYTAKITQLHHLLDLVLPNNAIYFASGDFNFVESPDDTSSPHWSPPPQRFLDAWEEFLIQYQLRELHQPTPTFYRRDTTSSIPHTTSRLDRHYCSLTELDFELLNPSAHLAALPHGLLTSNGGVDTLYHRHQGSDHLAVGARFTPFSPDGNTKRQGVPSWVARDPAFAPTFQCLWEKGETSGDAFAELARLKSTLIAAKSVVLKRRAAIKDRKLTATGQLAVGIKLLRLLAAKTLTRTTAKRYAATYHFLQQCSDPAGDLDPTLLRDHLNSLFSQHGEPAPSPAPSDPTTARHAAKDINHDPAAAHICIQSPSTGPSACTTQTPTRHSPLEHIKVLLPSTRSRLTGLRASMDSPLVTEATAMATLAAEYWSDIWSSKHAPAPGSPLSVSAVAAERRATHLRHYCTPIDLSAFPDISPPEIPSEQLIAKVIRNAGNSCAGPDGIPFACYKAIAATASTVFQGVITALASGELPPAGYNFGLLFLLPKKGTLLPSDTRPITVTNADNRLVAAAVVRAFEPFLQEVLHKAQQGFVRGRSGSVNIKGINAFFYEAAGISAAEQRRRSAYLLFLDTAKAFDSIEHDFIIASLRRLCVPEWIINLVKGLLHEVRVTPFFGAPTAVWIQILCGVKQGCPLSPLLFLICYDGLLCRLASLPGIVPFAFADDLAVAATIFLALHAAMRAIDAFKAASGLGQNMDKTVVISAHDSRDLLQSHVLGSPWPSLTIRDHHTCLGIPVGNDLTLESIYDATLTKMEARCAKWSGAFRTMSLERRILTMNVFVLSMLVYIGMFFPLPYGDGPSSASKRCEALFRKHIVFCGSGYRWEHLVSPQSRFGPRPSLIDPWARSVATLASQTDLSLWDGYTDVEIEDYRVSGEYEALVTRSNEGILHMSDLRALAAIDAVVADLYAQYPAEGESPTFVAATYTGNGLLRPRERRRLLERRIVYSTYHYTVQDPDLVAKFTERGLHCTPTLLANLHAAFASMPAKLKPHYRNTQFNLTLNALPTETRMFWRVDPDKTTRDALPRPRCYFCAAGEDSITHMYSGSCARVADALHRYSTAIQVDLTPQATGAQNALASAFLLWSHPHPERTQAMVIFNSSVWFERCNFFAFNGTTTADQTADRLSRAAILNWSLHCHVPKKPKSKSEFGSAGRRTPAQGEAARSLAHNIITAIAHDDTIVAYTDGASKGNPGPCGAGAIITYPHWGHRTGKHTEELSAGLGHGTNQLGELWAIGMVLEDTAAKIRDGYTPPEHGIILTDSKYAKGCLTGGWCAQGANAPLVASLRSLLATSPVKWTIEWIPGHSDVTGNDAADSAAVRGAKRSAASLGYNELNTRIANNNYLP